MELPSMVERNGNRLVVRSLVSGATVYQTASDATGTSAARSAKSTHPLVGAEILERQLQLLNNRTAQARPLLHAFTMPETSLPATRDAEFKEPQTAQSQLEGKTEDLPQCKIRRNYSCNTCAFFTQNPRSHLSHLRDVHGEKIVINECKLCLYASRHFQKLVRHMKMVHGCTDDDSNGIAGRRHSNREARKRRLEESVETAAAVSFFQSGPTLKQLKSELQLQEQQLMNNVEAFNRQQQLQQLQHMVSRGGNIFSMAFEFQLCMLPPTTIMNSTNATANCLKEAQREAESSSSSDEPLPLDECLTPEALDLSSGSSVAQYQCKKCSYSTPIRARFKKHVKYHSMPLIKCGSCDFHSPYKWNLDRHTKNHGANGYFKCNVCDFSTNIKQSLTIHELNHHVALRRTNATDQVESVEHAAPTGTETCRSPIMTAASSSPLTELPSIICSHCQQRIPNAMELVSHLQQCEPAQRTSTQLSRDLELANDDDYRHADSDLSYYGVETAPGYGEVTDHLQPEDSDALKKVFKCPHCTFWAATASRFHVHIVGHLNRKPFECSLCSYRSNWRWDITKHIRLKAMRDKSHTQAQVLMNDETGRRNYAKYNQYLTLMKVSAEQAADAKTMRCGEMHTCSSEQQVISMPQMDEETVEAQLVLEPQRDTIAALDLSMTCNQSTEQTELDNNILTKSHKQRQTKKQQNLDLDEL